MSNVFLIVAVTIRANKKACMCVRNNPKRDVITCVTHGNRCSH